MEDSPLDGTLKGFSSLCDFFNLEQAVLLIRSPFEETLVAAAWSCAPQNWKIDLEPPLRIRLSAGLPQILTGSEKTAFTELAKSRGITQTWALALPLLHDFELTATLVLLEVPIFDLEDPDFFAKWDIFRQYLLKNMIRDRGDADQSHSPPGLWLRRVREKMERILSMESRVLLVHYSLKTAYQNLEKAHFPLLPGPFSAQILDNLHSLTGQSGWAFMKDEASAFAILALPPRLDAEILIHQLTSALSLIPGLPTPLRYKIITDKTEIKRLEPGDFPWKD